LTGTGGSADVEVDDIVASLDAARIRIAQLETALESRILIEQAKGILRERFGWSTEEAFQVLRYAARSSRIRIHALAAKVVHETNTPAAITVAAARGSRWRAVHAREHPEAQRARANLLDAQIPAQPLRAQQEDGNGRWGGAGRRGPGETRRRGGTPPGTP
jgi:hypothetical protein